MGSPVFTVLDYIVLVGSLVLAILVGVYYAFIKKQETNEDLLVGGRSLSVIPVAFSIMVTYISAITVLGTPAEVYYHGSLIITFVIEGMLFVPISCFLFVPVFYKLQLTSINEYLEWRFDSVAVRWLTSVTFIVETVTGMGIVLFAPTLAMQTFLGIPIWASILIVGGCGTVYTAIGGLKAVVWTDAFQALVVLVGMTAIIVKSLISVGGISRAFQIAEEHGRLQFFDWNPSIFVRQTTFTIFFGSGLITIALCSTHQPMVQRYSGMSSIKKAMGAMMLSIPIYFCTFLMSMLAGITIFAYYAGCDPLARGDISRPDEIVPYYVAEELSAVNGMMGLFMAALFSASLSTVSSGFNSLAAVTWEDFFAKSKYFESMSQQRQGSVTKCLSAFYGVLSMGFAFLATGFGEIFAASFSISGAIIGPLGGVFMLGLLFPFVNKWGASIGMIVGHAVTLWIYAGALLMGGQHDPLPTRTDQCPGSSNYSTIMSSIPTSSSIMPREYSTAFSNSTAHSEDESEWPEKLFKMSYLLYAAVGMLTTVIVGILVSLVTKPSSLPERKERLIHPWVVRLYKFIRRVRYGDMRYKAVEVKLEKRESNLYIT